MKLRITKVKEKRYDKVIDTTYVIEEKSRNWNLIIILTLFSFFIFMLNFINLTKESIIVSLGIFLIIQIPMLCLKGYSKGWNEVEQFKTLKEAEKRFKDIKNGIEPEEYEEEVIRESK